MSNTILEIWNRKDEESQELLSQSTEHEQEYKKGLKHISHSRKVEDVQK